MIVNDNTEWNMETEIVIIGYGMAGAVAAIEADNNDAEVIILEKQPAENHHSNSSLSSGVFVVPDNIEEVIKYVECISTAINYCNYDKEIIRVWAEYSCENGEWMEKIGIKPKKWHGKGDYKHLPGSDSMHVYAVTGMGIGMMRMLYKEVTKRSLQTIYNMQAKNILTKSEGEVIGVRASDNGNGSSKHINIKASKAVILTCGGFEFNEQMKFNYLPVYPAYFAGSPANTGDGIRMAQEVGADLWHMNCVSAGALLKIDDSPVAFPGELGGPGWLPRHMRGDIVEREKAGYIVVDKKGKRFINENKFSSKSHSSFYELTVLDTETLEYPRIPCYWILDQKRIDAGPLIVSKGGPVLMYRWSNDNAKEIEKGWIIKAETIRQLAINLKIEPESLSQTVAEYNICCDNSEDPYFGRGEHDLVPLTSPPFYAVSLWPGGPNTQGGPKRNHKAQILNTNGMPIPRLYAAGELGSIFGKIYPGTGSNLSECIAFGRIAAENAVKEDLID